MSIDDMILGDYGKGCPNQIWISNERAKDFKNLIAQKEFNMNIKDAWDKFFGKGWSAIDTPSKLECFEAGFKAALSLVQNNECSKLTKVTLNGEVKYEASSD